MGKSKAMKYMIKRTGKSDNKSDIKTEKPAKKKSKSSAFTDDTLSILKVIILLLLVLNVFAVLRGSEQSFTFTGLLHILEEAPAIDISWINKVHFEIPGDWGIVDFLRKFLNQFSSVLQAVLFIGTGLAQFFTYVGHFFYYMFL